jgi:hypothetical protein
VHDPFPKDMATGSYDLVALHVLSQGPAYVYGIIRRISERTNHLVRWREGTAYRVLHDLERRGLVRSERRNLFVTRPISSTYDCDRGVPTQRPGGPQKTGSPGCACVGVSYQIKKARRK